MPDVPVAKAFGQENLHALTPEVARLVPEELRNLMIREYDRARRINDHHCVWDGIKNLAHQVGGLHCRQSQFAAIAWAPGLQASHGAFLYYTSLLGN
jgi:hypothetical protein